MNTKLLTGIIGATLLLSPLTFAQDDRKPAQDDRKPAQDDRKPSPTSRPSRSTNVEGKRSGMSDDVREAVAWERAKDRAAARQERMEGRRPTGDRDADRTRDRTVDDRDPGRKVKDTKAPGARQDQ